MARYSLFVLKVPLNTNQPTNLWVSEQISLLVNSSYKQKSLNAMCVSLSVCLSVSLCVCLRLTVCLHYMIKMTTSVKKVLCCIIITSSLLPNIVDNSSQSDIDYHVCTENVAKIVLFSVSSVWGCMSLCMFICQQNDNFWTVWDIIVKIFFGGSKIRPKAPTNVKLAAFQCTVVFMGWFIIRDVLVKINVWSLL